MLLIVQEFRLVVFIIIAHIIVFKHVFDFNVMSVLEIFHLYMMENTYKFYEGENVN
jgi:hypothetical protein